MSQPQALWTKDFVLISLANLFLFTSFYLLLPTLPLYVTDALGGNEGNVGYIIGVLSIAAVTIRPLSGYLLDTLGRKKVVLIALIAFVATTLAYNLASSLLILFALRALHGFSWGFITTGLGTIASDIVPASRRGEGMGYYGLANTFAMALGPILGVYILAKLGFQILFISSFLVAALSLICILVIKGSADDVLVNKQSKLSFNSFFEPRVYSLAVIMFFTTFIYSGIVSFITLYAEKLGITNAGIFFLIYGISLLLVRPYAGKFFDKHGPNRMMLIGFLATAASFFMLFAARGYLSFIAAAVVLGLGFGIILPSIMAMAINRVEPYRRGAANGTVFTAIDLGIGFGSILLGLLSKKIGLSYMYLICAFLTIIPTLIFYIKLAKQPLTSTK